LYSFSNTMGAIKAMDKPINNTTAIACGMYFLNLLFIFLIFKIIILFPLSISPNENELQTKYALLQLREYRNICT